MNLAGTWRKNIPGRGYGRGKGLEVGVRWTCLGNSNDKESWSAFTRHPGASRERVRTAIFTPSDENSHRRALSGFVL